MKYSDFKSLVENHLARYKLQTLGIADCGYFREKEYSHILPPEKLHFNFLPILRDIVLTNVNLLNYNLEDKISLHMYANHLNSSQVMCLNFFAPFLQSANGRTALVKIFSDLLKKDFSNAFITQAGFEYVPNKSENTNFDFYCKMSSGEQIFIEAKYTEQCFGKISVSKDRPDKYKEKWAKIYSSHVDKSIYLKGISESEFYKNYQINRNISYVQSEKDFSLFLFPQKSEYLYEEVNQTILSKAKTYKNIGVFDWIDFYQTATEHRINFNHNFVEFENKYLCYM